MYTMTEDAVCGLFSCESTELWQHIRIGAFPKPILHTDKIGPRWHTEIVFAYWNAGRQLQDLRGKFVDLEGTYQNCDDLLTGVVDHDDLVATLSMDGMAIDQQADSMKVLAAQRAQVESARPA